MLQEVHARDEVEPGDEHALVGERAGEPPRPASRLGLEERGQEKEERGADDHLGQERLQRVDELELAVQHDLADGQEHGAQREHEVPGEDGRAGGHGGEELSREQDEDARVAEQDADELGSGQTVAGDHEVREKHGVDGVHVQQDGRVPGRRQPRAHVEEAELGGEEEAEAEEGPGLTGPEPERGARPPAPSDHAQPAEDEPHPGQSQRWRIGEADLHGDDVPAPEGGEEEDEHDGARTELPRPTGGCAHREAPGRHGGRSAVTIRCYRPRRPSVKARVYTLLP